MKSTVVFGMLLTTFFAAHGAQQAAKTAAVHVLTIEQMEKKSKTLAGNGLLKKYEQQQAVLANAYAGAARPVAQGPSVHERLLAALAAWHCAIL